MVDPIRIDVWSDVVCPWCYIGKRNLETGLAEFASHDGAVSVDVEYHSFELAPDTPVDFDGDAADYLHKVRGFPEETVRQMIERVVGIAASVGLDFNYETIQHTNTVLAHQVIHYAKTKGLQDSMVERLSRAYFMEGRHIGLAEELADLGAEVGLDREEILRILDEETYLSDVRADQRQAQVYGIGGVPFFVIDGRYGVSGAQPPEVFVNTLAQIAAERVNQG